MESNEKQISQKDYLKKYLSKDKGEKKKKKVKISSSSHLKRSIIIDDDLGLPNVASIDDEEFNLDYLGDEAPQVAGIIDERPLEIRAKESHGSDRWKPVGEPGELEVVNNILERLTKHGSNKSELNGKSHTKDGKKVTDSHKIKKEAVNTNYKKDSDSDLSPQRTKKVKHSDSDSSPSRKKGKGGLSKYRNNDSDSSPPRRKGPMKYQDNDSDLSPPRKKENQNKYKDSDSDLSPPRKKGKENRDKYQNSDLSPTRAKMKSIEGRRKDKHSRESGHTSRNSKYNKRSSDSDLSPPRKEKKSVVKDIHINLDTDSDLSPPRKRNEFEGRKVKHKTRDSDFQHKKKRHHNGSSDSDLSPERIPKKESSRKNDDYFKEKSYRKVGSHSKRGSDFDRSRKRSISSNRSSKKKKTSSDSDLSPPRKHNYEKDKKRKDKFIDDGEKKLRDHNSDSDLSPPRKCQQGKYGSEGRKVKMDRTLDGKKAGLQDAKNLKEELRKLKEAEDVAFSKLQASVSGKNASAVMRDRKTGKIRDLEKEKQEIIEKSAKQIEREKKYEKWGKGLKQVEEAEERLAEVLHEMNKPLARYAGDDDLENMLKSREREGDPMLDYIRSKQAESISLDVAGKPKYQGHFMPNRFGIRPGHRWDGVDRSNGYEKSWFERQNARKAVQEEAYKWSTSDM